MTLRQIATRVGATLMILSFVGVLGVETGYFASTVGVMAWIFYGLLTVGSLLLALPAIWEH